MENQRSSVPISGHRPDLERALHASLDAWAPGAVQMHSPLHARTTVRVIGVPVEVDLVVDGPDVRPMPDRRRLLVLPRRHWLPELEGALLFTDTAAGGSGVCMVFEWWVHRDGPLPGPIARLMGQLMARAILQPAAAAVSQLARARR